MMEKVKYPDIMKWLVVILFSILFLSGCKSREYTVTFMTSQEDVYNQIKVGTNFVELPVPAKKGYDFSGWYDSEGNKYPEEYTFTVDTTLFARWAVKVFSVTLLDYNDNIITVATVEYGDSYEPSVISFRKGYEFIGWDHDLNIITEDLVVRPEYRKQNYRVVFLDYDGTIVSDQIVPYGEAAQSPPPLHRDGYVFIEWDQELYNVEADMTIQPIYEKVDFEFSFRDGGYYITNYYGDNKHVIIPDYYRNLPVIGIAKSTFEKNYNLESIILPTSLITIEERAFYNCKLLTSIGMPDKVEAIGNYAFADCWSLQEVILSSSLLRIGERVFSGCDMIEEIVLPESIIAMGDGVFENCSRMKRVEIYSQIIGIQAFLSCSSLGEVIIYDSVQVISSHAFYSCSRLNNIYLPVSIIAIGDHAFSWCRNLQYVCTDAENLENLQTILTNVSHIYTEFEIIASKKSENFIDID